MVTRIGFLILILGGAAGFKAKASEIHPQICGQAFIQDVPLATVCLVGQAGAPVSLQSVQSLRFAFHTGQIEEYRLGHFEPDQLMMFQRRSYVLRAKIITLRLHQKNTVWPGQDDQKYFYLEFVNPGQTIFLNLAQGFGEFSPGLQFFVPSFDAGANLKGGIYPPF